MGAAAPSAGLAAYVALGWHLLSAGGLLDRLVSPGMTYHIIARSWLKRSKLDDSIPPTLTVERAAVLSLRGTFLLLKRSAP